MSKKGLPPRFKPRSAPQAVSVQKLAKTGNYRGSPRTRGYDSRWDRLSIAFRKKNPFCLWCQQQGRDTLTDLVDHMIPVVDRPDLKHDWKNLLPLCTYHHGVKGSMEIYAREKGLLDMLPIWCRDPAKRPRQFAPAVEC